MKRPSFTRRLFATRRGTPPEDATTRPSGHAVRHRVPAWVNVADVATVGLAAVTIVVLVTGGVRLEYGAFRFSVTSETRLFFWAVGVGVLRHLAFRRPNLRARLRAACDHPPIRRLLTRIERAVPMLRDDHAFLPSDGVLQPRGRALTTLLEVLVVTAVMIALTAFMTYPQVRHLDAARDLGDPVFSTWRLAWLAHQFPRDPLHLFDANIFYPERWTLAYSDPILLPGLAAAPFIWLGVPPVVVYTLLVLASFVLAGVCMYFFVRALTGSRPGAMVAAVGFAFYPFRFEHYSHLELLLSFWVPLALWALHRTLVRGRIRDGVLLGVVVAAQFLTSTYFGIMLVAFIVPLAAAMSLGWDRVRQNVRPLVAGIVLSGVLVAPVVVPYLQARRALGDRNRVEVDFYSPSGPQYLVAHSASVVYGNTLGANRKRPEMDLFPGFVIVALTLVAVWPPLSVTRLAYLVALLLTFDASLGFHGLGYPVLYKWIFPFRGLRVPARFSMLLGVALSVMAAYGTSRLGALVRRAWFAWLLAAVMCAGLLVEDRAAFTLETVWPVHPIYRFFDGRPTGVIAELPVSAETPWDEARYMYFSTFHWQRLLNGDSGHFSRSWSEFAKAMKGFPDDRSMRLLKTRRTDYVIVHEEIWGAGPYERALAAAGMRTDLKEVARARWEGSEARIYKVLR